MKTNQIILASKPTGMPTINNFRFEEVTLPPIQKGEVLLKPLYFSVDPYLRHTMDKTGIPMTSIAIARVEESHDANKFKKGDTVIGMLPWATHAVKEEDKLRKIETTDVPVSYYLGVLGMPGLTAYFGMTDICRPKPKETVVISGAAGAVGIVAGQIARIMGARVIGITGSDEKADLITHRFGYDEAINYKNVSNLDEAISKVCPNGIDCYFDNVGGDVSDTVIKHINFDARIAICGQIALYNEINLSTGIRILPQILTKSATVQGFMVNNYNQRFPEGLMQLSKWIREGRLKYTETVIDGFKHLPEAFIALFEGKNTGKMIVKTN